ncbi:hypothetical protein [Schnuerera sp.]|uniref:hypothetical protein n=1 Tax=Schnuerera sp. TaxID=2794844 RepID=UPI002C26D662|nr:hypothetical protein [Schnuerera sp.]HSH36067.1 hypothetical protein [Schnuerera sp.]
MNSLKNIYLLLVIICLICHSYMITILKKNYDEILNKQKNILETLDDLIETNNELTSDKEEFIELIKNMEKDKLKPPNRNMISRNVPKNSSRKTYMDYRKITDSSSKQYELQQNKDCYTTDTGFRKLNEYYCIAVGTHYSNSIGDKLIVHMENGESFKVIVADIKDDKHTDETNMQHRKDGSVIEFVVDTKKLPELVRKMGDISYMNETFRGEIKAIIKEN